MTTLMTPFAARWIATLTVLLAAAGSQPAQAQFGPARQPLPAQCTFNDQCAQPLICAGRLCREQCRSDRDCSNGWVCQQQVWSDAGGVGDQNRFLEVYVPHSRIESQPGVEAAARGDVRGVCVAPGLISPSSRVQPEPPHSDPKKDPKAVFDPLLKELFDKRKFGADEKSKYQKKP